MNNIIIPTSDLYRISMFDKYLNVNSIENNDHFIFIADDRFKHTREEYQKHFESLKNNHLYTLHYTRDFIEEVRPYFAECRFFDEILKAYPVCMKLLIFIWSKHVLGLDKAMMMDDDVLYLVPLKEKYENYDYVKKADGISKMCRASVAALEATYPEINIREFERTRKSKINSGTLIYTHSEKYDILNWMQRFFDSEHLCILYKKKVYEYENGISKLKYGCSWIIEQYIYGMFFDAVVGIDKFHEFGSSVNISVSGYCKNPKTITKIPNIVHLLLKNKEVHYEYYTTLLDKYLKQKKDKKK